MKVTNVDELMATIKEVREAFDDLKRNSEDVLSFLSEDIKPQFQNHIEVANEHYNDAEFISNMSEKHWTRTTGILR